MNDVFIRGEKGKETELVCPVRFAFLNLHRVSIPVPVCVFRVVFLNTVKVVVVIAEIVISVPVVTAIYSNYITEKLSQFSCFLSARSQIAFPR